MAEHKLLSPSASDRWLECAIAPHREKAAADKSSSAAEEGTAGHSMGEHCLNNDIDTFQSPTDPRWDKWDTPEFRAYVQEYVSFVREKVGNGHLFVEQYLQIFPTEDVWGTADAVIVGHEAGLMDIVDLKFGQGIIVEADDNSQLKLYGWGGYQSLEWLSEIEIDRIRVTIFQPRRGHVVSKTFTVEELTAWITEITPKVRAAFSGAGLAKPGDHCRWCRVRATCAERREFIKVSAAMDFADGCKPEVHDKDEEELVRIFKNIPLIQQYLKDIETWVADKSHEQGHALPGLKYVQGRGVRVITDPDNAAKALKEIGVEPFGEPKLLGITEIEKRLKGIGVKLGDVIGKFVEIKTSDPVLVGEADKRPAYDPTSGAKQDFS